MSNSKFFIKVLRKLTFTRKLKLRTRIELHGQVFQIPIIADLGYVNILQKESWISSLIAKFNLKNDEIFVDVGVNLGQSLLQLKSVNSEVKYIGFEPNINCCFYTNELIKVNQFKNCELLNVALSNELSLVDLEFDSDSDARASINAGQRPAYFQNKMKVVALSFDQIFDAKNVSFLKIDVEGAELNVLKGFKKQLLFSKPIVVCEVLDSHNEAVLEQTQKQASELFSFLEEIDFVAIQLIQDEKLKAIKDYKILSHFEIQLWEKKSSQLNDYLFVHQEKLENTLQVLSQIKV